MMQCNNVCAKLLVARVGQPCTKGLLSTEVAVYMGGGTGRLPGRDVFHPGFT